MTNSALRNAHLKQRMELIKKYESVNSHLTSSNEGLMDMVRSSIEWIKKTIATILKWLLKFVEDNNILLNNIQGSLKAMRADLKLLKDPKSDAVMSDSDIKKIASLMGSAISVYNGVSWMNEIANDKKNLYNKNTCYIEISESKSSPIDKKISDTIISKFEFDSTDSLNGENNNSAIYNIININNKSISIVYTKTVDAPDIDNITELNDNLKKYVTMNKQSYVITGSLKNEYAENIVNQVENKPPKINVLSSLISEFENTIDSYIMNDYKKQLKNLETKFTALVNEAEKIENGSKVVSGLNKVFKENISTQNAVITTTAKSYLKLCENVRDVCRIYIKFIKSNQVKKDD